MSHPIKTTLTHKLSPPGLKLWFGSRQEWESVVLVFLTLAIAVWSIEQARWITPQPSLTLVLGLAVLTGRLLVKSRLPGATTFSLMIILGIVVTVWQSASLLPPPLTTASSNHFIAALQSWWQAIINGRPNEGTIHFAVFLVFLSWITGYISTWFILRKQNAWVAVLLGTIIILANLSNLTEEYYHFFLFYSLAALLLIGQVNLTREHNWFKKYNISYPSRGTAHFTASLIFLSVLTVFSTGFIPEIQVKQVESIISPLIPRGKNINEHWLNFFAAVPGKWNIIRSSQQEVLSFSDVINYSNELQFMIASEQPAYWRTRRYDTYHSWGWTSGAAAEQILKPETPVTGIYPSPNRRELTYTVENMLKTDVLLTTGEFISTDIPVLLQTLAAESSSANLSVSSGNNPLSPDTALAAALSPRVVSAGDLKSDPNKIEEPLPGNTILTSVIESQYLTAEPDKVIRAPDEAGDIIAVITPQLLKPNQRYTAIVSISTNTPAELSQAGEDYAPWIIDYYLQLPDSLPEQVRQLSRSLTEEAETAYDKVITIKHFLNEFKYNEEVKDPPKGADGVDYFLFEQQEGDCVNFASTMVVMLRSIGVPARLVAGYLPGTFNENTGSFMIRARNYHTWAEVYFPGYGWVEFEATTRLETREFDIFNAGDDDQDFFDEEDEELSAPSGTSLEETDLRKQPGQNSPSGIISITFLLLLALGIVLYRWLRHFREAEQAPEVYARMSFLASLIKSGPRPPETPLEYCARLALLLPAQAEAIDHIAQAYVESRFSSRKKLFLPQQVILQRYWRDVYRALLKRLLHLSR